MDPATPHICPLCGTDFEGAECHSACPMSRGCAMVKCPACEYEFVEKSGIVNWLTRLWKGTAHDSSAGR
jgi:hypothetical protein